MHLLRRAAIALIVLVVVIVLVAAALPREWSVERSISITASRQRLFPLIASPRRWQDWSVWTRSLDPRARIAFEGPESGVGARVTWLGPTLGNGHFEITAADSEQGVRLDQALESNTVNAHAVLLFTTVGDATTLTWTDEGSLPPFLGLFRHEVEGRLGANLEESLRQLKVLAEQEAANHP